MRNNQEIIAILEGFARSNGLLISDKIPNWIKDTPQYTGFFYNPVSSRAAIYVHKRDKRSKYLVPFIAHEIGHYFFERELSVDDCRAIQLAYVCLNLFGQRSKSILKIEKEAWKIGRYILLSLGLMNPQLKQLFNIAQTNCLNTYKGIHIPEKDWI